MDSWALVLLRCIKALVNCGNGILECWLARHVYGTGEIILDFVD